MDNPLISWNLPDVANPQHAGDYAKVHMVHRSTLSYTELVSSMSPPDMD
jgi:hypothetical protein